MVFGLRRLFFQNVYAIEHIRLLPQFQKYSKGKYRCYVNNGGEVYDVRTVVEYRKSLTQ